MNNSFASKAAAWLESLALIVLLAGMVSTPLISGGTTAEGIFAARAGVLLALLVSLAAFAIRGGWRWPPLLLGVPLAVYLGAAGASTLQTGLFMATEELYNIVTYAAGFVLMVHLVSTARRVQWVLAAVGLLALALGVYGVMQVFGIEFTNRVLPGDPRKISSFYFNQAHYGGMLALLLPLGWAMFLYSTRWFPRLFWLLVTGLLSVNLLFTSSWDSMIAAGGGLVLVSLIWAGHRRNYLRLAGIAVLTAALLGGGFWAFTQRPQAVERMIGIKPQVLVTYLERVIRERMQINRTTLESFRESPWLGVGPAQLINHNTVYRSETVAEARVTHRFVNYAHNDLLQVLSETGVLGLLGWASFVLMGLLYRSRLSPMVAVGVFGGVAALLLHSFTDSNMTVIAGNALLAWGLLGLRVCNPATEGAPYPIKAQEPTKVEAQPQTPVLAYATPTAGSSPKLKPADPMDDFEEQIY
ncbi:MAG: O-antigen ligase family protein [Meiothermus sp.]|nr:O-antigen ligase family protein [Meiothermus sp.]